MDWYPQALLTAEQACRRRFSFLKNDAPLLEMTVLLCCHSLVCVFTYF